MAHEWKKRKLHIRNANHLQKNPSYFIGIPKVWIDKLGWPTKHHYNLVLRDMDSNGGKEIVIRYLSTHTNKEIK